VNFPQAHRYRVDQQHIFAVKFLDPYFVSDADAVLVLDTDILWFQEPLELLKHIETGQEPLFWYSKVPVPFLFKEQETLREELMRLNSGVVFYRKNSFDLHLAEAFFSKLGPQMGPFLLDQPEYAYVLGAKGNAVTLPADKYLMTGYIEATIVAKHYTNPHRFILLQILS
jgi:hypothetical protein